MTNEQIHLELKKLLKAGKNPDAALNEIASRLPEGQRKSMNQINDIFLEMSGFTAHDFSYEYSCDDTYPY
jgi:hypothetical protein